MAYILVVDDEEDIRELLRAMLEEAGHVVETACDGADGVCRFHTKQPDLVVTDILMPNMGGLNLITEVRRQHPDLPVIAISGGGTDGKLNFLKTAKTFPGVKTMDKPFGNQEFLDAVGEVLG